MVVCVRGRQVHAEWGWLAAGGASELDWWLYATSWSPTPTLRLHNGHLGTHQQKRHKKQKSTLKNQRRTRIHMATVHT